MDLIPTPPVEIELTELLNRNSPNNKTLYVVIDDVIIMINRFANFFKLNHPLSKTL